MENEFTSRHLGNLSIFTTGREECKPGHCFSTAFTDRFLVHYIVSGEGLFQTGGREYKLEAGNAFLIGNQYGYYQADWENPWTYIWINFSGEIAVKFLKDIGLDNKKPVYKTTEPKELAACFENMLSITNWKNEFMVYSRFFYLLGTMQETNANKIISKEKSVSEYVSQCSDFIQANYYRSICVKDMCNFVGIEYSYLFRLFKQQLNVSPGKYLIDYRLSKAGDLLKDTQMNVNEIASAVGYEDRAAFSKAFSRKYGVPPREYRWRMCGWEK